MPTTTLSIERPFERTGGSRGSDGLTKNVGLSAPLNVWVDQRTGLVAPRPRFIRAKPNQLTSQIPSQTPGEVGSTTLLAKSTNANVRPWISLANKQLKTSSHTTTAESATLAGNSWGIHGVVYSGDSSAANAGGATTSFHTATPDLTNSSYSVFITPSNSWRVGQPSYDIGTLQYQSFLESGVDAASKLDGSSLQVMNASNTSNTLGIVLGEVKSTSQNKTTVPIPIPFPAGITTQVILDFVQVQGRTVVLLKGYNAGIGGTNMYALVASSAADPTDFVTGGWSLLLDAQTEQGGRWTDVTGLAVFDDRFLVVHGAQQMAMYRLGAGAPVIVNTVRGNFTPYVRGVVDVGGVPLMLTPDGVISLAQEVQRDKLVPDFIGDASVQSLCASFHRKLVGTSSANNIGIDNTTATFNGVSTSGSQALISVSVPKHNFVLWFNRISKTALYLYLGSSTHPPFASVWDGLPLFSFFGLHSPMPGATDNQTRRTGRGDEVLMGYYFNINASEATEDGNTFCYFADDTVKHLASSRPAAYVSAGFSDDKYVFSRWGVGRISYTNDTGVYTGTELKDATLQVLYEPENTTVGGAPASTYAVTFITDTYQPSQNIPVINLPTETKITLRPPLIQTTREIEQQETDAYLKSSEYENLAPVPWRVPYVTGQGDYVQVIFEVDNKGAWFPPNVSVARLDLTFKYRAHSRTA